SVKLAAQLCTYYAESVMPLHAKAIADYKRLNLGFLEVPPREGKSPFTVKDGEIVDHTFNLKQLAEELPRLQSAEAPRMNSAVVYLNSLEAFAIPFTAGVADEDIGYRETARPFCQGAQLYMPAIFQ